MAFDDRSGNMLDEIDSSSTRVLPEKAVKDEDIDGCMAS